MDKSLDHVGRRLNKWVKAYYHQGVFRDWDTEQALYRLCIVLHVADFTVPARSFSIPKGTGIYFNKFRTASVINVCLKFEKTFILFKIHVIITSISIWNIISWKMFLKHGSCVKKRPICWKAFALLPRFILFVIKEFNYKRIEAFSVKFTIKSARYIKLFSGNWIALSICLNFLSRNWF